MKSRPRTLPWLMLAVLAAGPARARAQDTPLYRDPSPAEGPRIEGPLLPPRPPTPTSTVPPPSGLGPFQASTPGVDTPAEPPGQFREPLLGIPPIPPPLPAFVMSPPRPAGDVEVRRTTKIHGPNGVLGRFHEWFHDACFGPPRPSGKPVAPRRGLFAAFHSSSPEADAPARPFNWPAWPTWPTSAGR